MIPMFSILGTAAFSINTMVLILIVAALTGLVFWAALKYLAIPQPFKGIVLFLIILVFVLWTASVLT